MPLGIPSHCCERPWKQDLLERYSYLVGSPNFGQQQYRPLMTQRGRRERCDWSFEVASENPLVLALPLPPGYHRRSFYKGEMDMPELGIVVFLIAMTYAAGVVWYTLLGRDHVSWMRIAAFPFVGAVLGESLVTAGPSLFGLHLYVILVSSLIAVTVDIAFSWIGSSTSVAKIAHLAVKPVTTLLGR